LNVEGLSWQVAQADDLARTHRLECELRLVEFGEFLQPRRLGEQAPVGLEQVDRLLLIAYLGMDLLHRRQLVLGLALGLVGQGRRRNHDGDQDNVAGTEHVLTSPPAGRYREALEGRKSKSRRRAPALRCGSPRA